MIVRVSGHGQYRLDDGDLPRLNELDNDVARAVEAGAEDAFRRTFAAMHAFVSERGTPVGADELVTSDHVLPPPDTTLEEAREAFAGEGIISG